MGRDDSLKILRKEIADIRFDNGQGYFFGYVQNGIVLLDGAKPNAVGDDRSGNKDANGKPAVANMLALARGDSGEGFLEYMFPKPGDTKPSPKLAYVRHFAPWDAVIGTGAYIDDVEAVYQAALFKLGGLAAAIILVAVLLVTVIA